MPKNLKPSVQLPVPFFAQSRFHCAPAALASAYRFRHLSVSPDDLVPQIYIPERKGSLQIEISANVRHHGLLPYPIGAKLEDILQEVAAQNPVLVLQNLGFQWWPRWHYALVVGYDLEKSHLLLHSGTHEYYRTSFRTFKSTWQRADHWGLLILPPTGIGVTAVEFSQLKAAHSLEEIGHFSAAKAAYTSALKRWPQSSLMRLALANVSVQLRDFTSAIEHYRILLRTDSENATAWNNLSYALLQAGCPLLADQAVREALRREPDNLHFIDSHEQIQHAALLGDNAACPQYR